MAVSGFLMSEAKDSHEYKAPALTELIENAEKLRAEYNGKNSSRLELISVLEVIHEFIKKLSATKKFAEIDLQHVCLGCWIFCLESIAQKYKVLNPEFEIGSVFNTGSKLYQLMLAQLHIGNNNQLNEQKKLEYLNKFYKFIYKEEDIPLIEELSIIEVLRSKRLRIDLKETLIQVMQDMLGRESYLEKRVLKAIPYENAIDQKIMKLQQDYKRQAKNQNPSRLFLINLAIAICKNNPPEEDPKKIIGHYLPRSQRIKMGCILYIMQSIAETYKFHLLYSPKDHSVLYKLCDQILVNSFKNLNDTTKLACFSAFLSYLNDFNNRKILEENMNKQLLEGEGSVKCIYIDSEINVICNDLNRMMRKLKPRTPSNATLAMAGLGALIGAAPGYGTGYGVGYGCTLTDQSNQYKQKVSGLTSYAMAVLFDGGEYFGYYTADIVVNATLERFYAKLFEAFGALVCAAGFGTMSFIIYDLSYETACNLCQLYLHLSKNVNPTLLSQSDLNFVNTLLDLPENVFSDSKKEKLRNITNISEKTTVLGFLSFPHSEEIKFEIIPMIKQKN